MRRNNNTTRKEGQKELREEKTQSDVGLPNSSPIYKPKGKYSKKSTNQSSLRVNNDQARLSIHQIEPMHPSNIVKNTQKTRI